MADTTKKYLSLDRLQEYDGLIKDYIGNYVNDSVIFEPLSKYASTTNGMTATLNIESLPLSQPVACYNDMSNSITLNSSLGINGNYVPNFCKSGCTCVFFKTTSVLFGHSDTGEFNYNIGDNTLTFYKYVNDVSVLDYANANSTSKSYSPSKDTDLSTKKYVDDNISSHNHDDVYCKSDEIDAKLSEVNTSIDNITNGEIVVKEAEHAGSADEADHATSADSATTANSATTAETAEKATQDADGNVITETYETKADAKIKYDEVNDSIKENSDAIAAEQERAEGIEESLQNQINTIMNNPDAEGAINSINEFTQYVKDHGTIADGFRTDINDLKAAVDGKATEDHSHAISDVTGLQDALNAKAAQSVLDAHTGDTTVHITATERTNWEAAYTHSQADHAPSNAQANVIESIKVNGTAQTITSKSVDITVPTKTSELTHDSGFLVASDIANKAEKATTLAGYGITDAYTKGEVDAKTEVDSALSATSTKPVQNKVVNEAIVTASNAILANTNSIVSHTDRIKALEDKVGEGLEPISSSEIQALFSK